MKAHFSLATLVTVFLLIVAGLVGSCTYDNEEALYGTSCDTALVSYRNSVAPIINQNCISCHGSASIVTSKPMDSYNLIRPYIQNGALGHSIRGTGGYNQMPPSGPLSACELRTIEKWIEAGYPDN